jgi:hypothetical protein
MMFPRNWLWVAVVLIWLPTITLKARAEPYFGLFATQSAPARNWCTPGVNCADTWTCMGDDYCPKSSPFTPCFTSRGCYNDYCKKVQPCEPQQQGRGCYNDYCKKSCPARLW